MYFFLWFILHYINIWRCEHADIITNLTIEGENMYIHGKMHRIQMTIMRGGTSKGLILRMADLPRGKELLDRIILRMYESPDHSQQKYDVYKE
jgi:hypothetical protein